MVTVYSFFVWDRVRVSDVQGLLQWPGVEGRARRRELATCRPWERQHRPWGLARRRPQVTANRQPTAPHPVMAHPTGKAYPWTVTSGILHPLEVTMKLLTANFSVMNFFF